MFKYLSWSQCAVESTWKNIKTKSSSSFDSFTFLFWGESKRKHMLWELPISELPACAQQTFDQVCVYECMCLSRKTSCACSAVMRRIELRNSQRKTLIKSLQTCHHDRRQSARSKALRPKCQWISSDFEIFSLLNSCHTNFLYTSVFWQEGKARVVITLLTLNL